MSQARDAILGKIRRSLGRGPLDPVAASDLDRRLGEPPAHLRPKLKDDAVALFIDKLTGVAGTIDAVATLADVPNVVAAFLRQHQQPKALTVAPDASLDGIAWPADMTIARRAAEKDDCTSLTGAFAGVAETGTLALLSGPASPTTLNFLPENHIVVLRRDQIVHYVEDVWARLRARGIAIPRSVNFITGPSRTADVEQTIQLGAHGPRRLHVVLVEE